MEVCDCNAGLQNLGRPGCVPIQSVTSSIILVPAKNSAGIRNGIDLGAALPVWSDLVNHTDPSMRWFPMPAFEDVTWPKADSIKAEAASGRTAKLRDGKRSYIGDLWEEDSSPTMLGKLEAAGCVDLAGYIVDVSGNLIGSFDAAANYLWPIPIDSASWDVKLMFPTDTDPSKIHVEFDIARLFKESTLKMLTAAEAGQDFTELEGLVDVVFTNESASAATQDVIFDAAFEYGTALNAIKYQGATAIPDWAIEVNGAPVVATLIVENPDGTYTITLTAASFVDTDAIKVTVTKDGFSGYVDIVAGA